MKEAVKGSSELKMNEDLAHRYLNEGFSGGEKKRNEILQMKLLKPSFALLDEIDSGLDVDALRIVADAVNKMKEENEMGLVMVSHYEKLYQLVKPSHVHVLVDGEIKAEFLLMVKLRLKVAMNLLKRLIMKAMNGLLVNRITVI